MDMGLMQCAIGDGKGKTTALIGQLVRAQGQGFKCVCFQFLKTQPSGECAALEQLGIPVERAQTDNTKFVFEMNAAEKGAYLMAQRALYTRAVRAVRSGEYDVVGLDEILDLVELGAVDVEALSLAMISRPVGVEVLLTGRSLPKKLEEAADYITRMESVRHPYDRGVSARRGIEY